MPLPRYAALRFVAMELGDLGERWRARLDGWLATEAERRRPFLWLPVAYGVGVALYFAADREPSAWSGPLAATVALVLAVAFRGHWRARTAFFTIAMLFLGFSVATLRTRWVDEPVVAHTAVVPLTGFVRSVEDRPQGPRAVIDVETIGNLAAHERPGRVRLTFRPGNAVEPGTRIAVTARLVPPPEPARPGGYDFARDAFFSGVGGVGSVNSRVEVLSPRASPFASSAGLAAWIDGHRNALTRRIIDAGGGQARAQEAAFVAALVTGKRGMLSDETNEALRAAGIYHVVSIGGFHMTLVAGTIFFLVRALLALSPGMTLRMPVRKAAAVAGIVGASLYCVFSGAGIDTLRALVVTLIVMGAILANRPALSMRNLALAAFVCLTFQPETLLGPSFQMSFAGVAALIALFERWSDGAGAHDMLPLREGGGLSLRGDGASHGWFHRLVIVSTATTVVAMLATGPFSTYHFQTFNPWGLVGNAFGLPLVELLVMPLAFMGVMTYPLGLDGVFWHLAGLAAVPVLAGSQVIEDFAGAVIVVPSFGPGVLVLLVAGLLWACLWTTPLRWFALFPASLGVALAFVPDRPDMLIDREGRGAVVRSGGGRYVVLGRPSDFTVAQWLRSDGDPRRPDDPSLRTGVACDRLGCVATLPDGRNVAFAIDQRALPDDCRRAAIVVTRWRAPDNCAARHVIDKGSLDRHGALALTFDGEALITEGERSSAGEVPAAEMRPWRRATGQ